MKNLNNPLEMAGLDRSDMHQSIGWLSRQCEQVWQDSKNVIIPNSYKNVSNIVVNGMGGSALGSYIIRALYDSKIKIPFRIINNYVLPESVNEKTLFIASSYSGNTEEVVNTVLPAIRRKAKVMIICGGGKLAELKEKYQLPGYVFDPQYNPSGQPRIGLGYSIFGQWILFHKAGIINLSDKQAKGIIDFTKKTAKKFNAQKPPKVNPAKQIAHELFDKIPMIVSSEHLTGNAHTFANQINENSKTFSGYYLISELNHHLMEGLRFPKTNPGNIHFVFFESKLFHKSNQRRYKITQEILQKNKISYSVYQAGAKDAVLQSFEVLLLGSYVSFYNAMLHSIDPSPIPWVDYFKDQLGKKK